MFPPPSGCSNRAGTEKAKDAAGSPTTPLKELLAGNLKLTKERAVRQGVAVLRRVNDVPGDSLNAHQL